MTVAAVVLVPDLAAALADAEGEPAVRRVLHAAWSGGAIPLIVVCRADGSAALAAAVADLPVTVATPPADLQPGAAWFGYGAAIAAQRVTETTAALLWPFRYTWVDPETVTTLIEAHGADDAGSIVRPAFQGEPGFPILLPAALGATFAAHPELHGFELVERLVAEGTRIRTVEVGDPGAIHRDPSRRADATYEGPPEPAGARPTEQREPG